MGQGKNTEHDIGCADVCDEENRYLILIKNMGAWAC